MSGRIGPAIERFWRQVDKTDSCWLWTSYTGRGYGSISLSVVPRVKVLAHRFAYETFVGPIPDGMTIDHTCHNADASCSGGRVACPHRRCVNPAHLEVATNRDNTLRGRGNAAINARMTRCAAGHEFAWEGVKHRRRRCQICARARARARLTRAAA